MYRARKSNSAGNSAGKLKKFAYGLLATLLAVILSTLQLGDTINKANASYSGWDYSKISFQGSGSNPKFKIIWQDYAWGDERIPNRGSYVKDTDNANLLNSVNKGVHIETLSDLKGDGTRDVVIVYNKVGVDEPWDTNGSATSKPWFSFFLTKGYDVYNNQIEVCKQSSINSLGEITWGDCKFIDNLPKGGYWQRSWLYENWFDAKLNYPFDDNSSWKTVNLGEFSTKVNNDGIVTGLIDKTYMFKYEGTSGPVRMRFAIKTNDSYGLNTAEQFIGAAYKSYDRRFTYKRFQIKHQDPTQWDRIDRSVVANLDAAKNSSCFASSAKTINFVFTTNDGIWNNKQDAATKTNFGKFDYTYKAFRGEHGPTLDDRYSRFFLNGHSNKQLNNNESDTIPYLQNGQNKYSLPIGFTLHYTYTPVVVNGRPAGDTDAKIDYYFTDVVDKPASNTRIQTAVNEWKTNKYDTGKQTLEEKEEAYTKAKKIQSDAAATIQKATTQCQVLDAEIAARDALTALEISDAYKTAARAKVDGLSDLNAAQKTYFKDQITNNALKKADVDTKVTEAVALNEAIKQLKTEIAKQPTVQKEDRYVYDTKEKQAAYDNAVQAGQTLLAKNENTAKTAIDAAKQKIIDAEKALNGRLLPDVIDGDPNAKPPTDFWRITLNAGEGTFGGTDKTKLVDVRTAVTWNHKDLIAKLAEITASIQPPNDQKAFIGWSPTIPSDNSLVSALPYTKRTFTAQFGDILKENDGTAQVDPNYTRLSFDAGEGSFANKTAKKIYLDVHKSVKWNNSSLQAKVAEYTGAIQAPEGKAYAAWNKSIPNTDATISDSDPHDFLATYKDKVMDSNGTPVPGYNLLTFKSSDKGNFGTGVNVKYVNVLDGVKWDDPLVVAKIAQIQGALKPVASSDIFTTWDQAIPNSGPVTLKTFTAIFNGIVIDVTDGAKAPQGYYRITLQAGKGTFSGTNPTTRLLDVHPTAVAWNNPVLTEKLKEITGMLQAPTNQGFTGWNPTIPSNNTLVSAASEQNRTFTASYGDLLKENDGSTPVDSAFYHRLSFDAAPGTLQSHAKPKIYLDVHKSVKWNNSALQAKVTEYSGIVTPPNAKGFTGWTPAVPKTDALIKDADNKDFTAVYKDKVIDSTGGTESGYHLVTFNSSNKGNFGNGVTTKHINVLNGVNWNDSAITAKITQIEGALKANAESDIFTGWDQPVPSSGAVSAKTFNATFNGKVIDGTGPNPPANYVRLTFKSSDDGRFGTNDSDNTKLVDVHKSLTWDAKELKAKITAIESSLQAKSNTKIYTTWNKPIPGNGAVNTDTFTAQFVDKVLDGSGDKAPSGYVRLTFQSSNDGKFDGSNQASQKLIDVQEKVAWNDPVLTEKIKGITDSLTAVSPLKAFVNWNPTVPTQGTVAEKTFVAVFKPKVTEGNGTKEPGYHLLTFNATNQGSFTGNTATKYLNVLEGLTWDNAVLKAEIDKLSKQVTAKDRTKTFLAWSPAPKTDTSKVADSTFDATYTDKVLDGSGVSAPDGYKRIAFKAGTDGEYQSGDKAVRYLDVYQTVPWNDEVLQEKIAALPAQLAAKDTAKAYTGWTPNVPKDNTLVKNAQNDTFTAVFKNKVKPGTGSPAEDYLSLNFKAGAGKFHETAGDLDDKYLDVLPGTSWTDPELTKAVRGLEALLQPTDNTQAFIGWDKEKLPTTGKVSTNGAKVFTAQYDAKVKVVESTDPENPLYKRISFNSGEGKFVASGKTSTDKYLDVHKATTWADPALKAKIAEIEATVVAPDKKAYVGWNKAFPADTAKVGDATAEQSAYTAKYSGKVEIGDGNPKDGYHLVTFDASKDGEFKDNPAAAGAAKKYLNILKDTDWNDPEVTSAITTVTGTLQAKTTDKIFDAWDKTIPNKGKVTDETFTARFVDKVKPGTDPSAPTGYIRLTFKPSDDGVFDGQTPQKLLDVYKNVDWNDPVLTGSINSIAASVKPKLDSKGFTGWTPVVPNSGKVKAETFTAVFKDKVKPGNGQPETGYVILHLNAGKGKFKSDTQEETDKYLNVLEGVTWKEPLVKAEIAKLADTLVATDSAQTFQTWNPVLPDTTDKVTAQTFTAVYTAKVLDGSGDKAPEGYKRLTFHASADGVFKSPGNADTRYLDVYQSVKWNDPALKAKVSGLKDLLEAKVNSKIFINWNPTVPTTETLVKDEPKNEFTASFNDKVIISEDGTNQPDGYEKLTFSAGLGQYGDNAQAKAKYLFVHPSMQWENSLITGAVDTFVTELKAPVAEQSFTKWTPSVPKSGAVAKSTDKTFTANYDYRIKVVTGTDPSPDGYVRMVFDANGGKFAAPANGQAYTEHKLDVKIGTPWDEVKAHMASHQPSKATMHFTSWTPDLAAKSGNVDNQSYNFTANYAVNIQEVPDNNVAVKPGFVRLDFQANGGEFADGKDLYQIDVKTGTAWTEVISHMDNHKPTKTGTFMSGWSPKLSAQGATVTDQSTKTFVAQYSENIIEVTDPSAPVKPGYVRLNFDANGGKYAGNKDLYQIDVKGGTDWSEVIAHMENHVPSKAGAHFISYSPDLSAKTGSVDERMPEADKTFTANYKDNIVSVDPQDKDYVTVVFKADADDVADPRGEFAAGEISTYWVWTKAQPVITLGDVKHPKLNVKAGYVFNTWDQGTDTEITTSTVVTAQYYFAPISESLVVDKGTTLTPEMFVQNRPGAGTGKDLPAGTGFTFVANRDGDPIKPPQTAPSTDKTIWNPEPVYVKVTYGNGATQVVEAKLKVRSDAEKYEHDLGNGSASGALVMRKNENPNSAEVLARVTLDPASNLLKGYKSINTTGHDFSKPTVAGQPIMTTGVVEFKDGSTYTVPVVRVTVEDLDPSVTPVIKTPHDNDDLWTDDREFTVEIPKIVVDGKEEVPTGDLVVKVGDQVVPGSAVTKRDDGSYLVKLPDEIKLSTTTPVRVEFTEPGKNPSSSSKSPVESQRHLFEPVVREVVVDKNVLPDASDLIANKDSDQVTGGVVKLPAGSSFEYVDGSGKVTVPDVSTAGKKPVKVKVTYPDGSFEIVDGVIKVRADAEKYTNDNTDKNGFNAKGIAEVVKGTPFVKEKVHTFIPELPQGAKLESVVADQIDVNKLTTTTPQKTTGKVKFADESTIDDFPIEVSVVAGQAGEYEPVLKHITVDKGTQVNPEDLITNKFTDPDPSDPAVKKLPENTQFIFVDDQGKETTVDTSAKGTIPVRIKVTYPDGSIEFANGSVTIRSDAEKYEHDLGSDSAAGSLVMKKNEEPNSAAVLARIELVPGADTVKGFKSIDTAGKDFSKPTVAGQPIVTTGVVEFKDGSTYAVPVVRVTVEDLPNSVVPVVTTPHDNDDLWTDDREFTVEIPKIVVDGKEEVPTGDLVVKVGDTLLPDSAVTKKDDGSYVVKLPDGVDLSTDSVVRVEFTEPGKNPSSSSKSPVESQRHLFEPVVREVVVDKGNLPDAGDLIANKDSDAVTENIVKLPSGTSFEYVDGSGKVTVPDVSTAGKKPVKVKVTYPDGSFEIVDGVIKVRTDAEKYLNDAKNNGLDPRGDLTVVRGQEPKLEEVKVDPTLPEGAKLTAFNEKIDVDTLTPADKPQKVTGVVTFADGSTINDLPINVYVVAGLAGEYEPLSKEIEIDFGGKVTAPEFIVNKFTDPDPSDPAVKKLPENTQFIFVDENGVESKGPNTQVVGSQRVFIKVLYSDGSFDLVKTMLKVNKVEVPLPPQPEKPKPITPVTPVPPAPLRPVVPGNPVTPQRPATVLPTLPSQKVEQVRPPVIDPVTKGDREITGSGVPGSTVVITLPGGSEVSVVVGKDGKFKIALARGVDSGTLRAIAKMNGYADSDEVKVKVKEPAAAKSVTKKAEPQVETGTWSLFNLLAFVAILGLALLAAVKRREEEYAERMGLMWGLIAGGFILALLSGLLFFLLEDLLGGSMELFNGYSVFHLFFLLVEIAWAALVAGKRTKSSGYES